MLMVFDGKKKYIDVVHLQHNVAVLRDEHSYKELFLYFHRPLIRFAATIVKSEEAAEEIYSDVLLRLWDLGSAFKNIENLRLYLYTSVKNASLNYLAKYYKVQTVDIDSVNLDFLRQPDPEESLLISEFQRMSALAINTLPAKCQMVYKLIREDGFNYKEVAEIMNISVNTVEGHMTTALKKISSSLRVYLRYDKN
jgi:RNA polymerase sigma-70 factor (family 1)